MSVVVDVELPVDDVPDVEDVVFELDEEGVVAGNKFYNNFLFVIIYKKLRYKARYY